MELSSLVAGSLVFEPRESRRWPCAGAPPPGALDPERVGAHRREAHRRRRGGRRRGVSVF
jgi:hypothetical protein